MYLDHTDDQAALLSTVSTILSKARRRLVLDGNKASFDAELDAELESNGMLLAASIGADGKPVLCTFAEEIAPGARVK